MAENVRVKVTAWARRERFAQIAPRQFEVAVKEKAEGNAANGRVRTLLARHFRVPLQAVRFIKGMRSPTKTFNVLK